MFPPHLSHTIPPPHPPVANLEFTIFTTSDIRITLQYLLMTQAMPNFTLRLAPRSPILLIDYLTDISPRPLACTTATRAPRRARRTRCVYCTYTSCCIPSILSLSSSKTLCWPWPFVDKLCESRRSHLAPTLQASVHRTLSRF